MDNDQFNTWWIQIRGDKNVPKTIADYIERDWLPHKQMLSPAPSGYVFCQYLSPETGHDGSPCDCMTRVGSRG